MATRTLLLNIFKDTGAVTPWGPANSFLVSDNSAFYPSGYTLTGDPARITSGRMVRFSGTSNTVLLDDTVLIGNIIAGEAVLGPLVGDSQGITLCDPSGNGYQVLFNSSNIRVYAMTGFVLGTLLGTIAFITTSGHTARFERQHDSGDMRIYTNTILRGTVTQANANTNWRAGIFVRNTASIASLSSIYTPVHTITITSAFIPGQPFSYAHTGFANGAASLDVAGVTIPVVVAGAAVTGTFPALADNTAIPLLPATGVTATMTQGVNAAPTTANIDLMSSWQTLRDNGGNPANFSAVVIDDDTFPSYWFNIAGQPLTTADRIYWPTATGLSFERNSGVTLPEISSPLAINLPVHRGSDSKTYFHQFTISESGISVDVRMGLRIDPRNGDLVSGADPNWPSGLVLDYRFYKGEPWVDKEGWTWTGTPRAIELNSGELGAKYLYSGGNDPFGEGAAAPEQYFHMPELTEFWFKRRIHIPANYYHRKVLEITLPSTTGWFVGDTVQGLTSASHGIIKYISATKIGLNDATNAGVNGHWNTTLTNVTRSLTAVGSGRKIISNNNKFQVFFSDLYSYHGHSPTAVFQLWARDFPDGTWGNGSDISLQVAVDLDNSGDQPNTLFGSQPFLDATDVNKWIDVVFYLKMATDASTYNGISKVFLRREGESGYTEKYSATNINMGIRPGYGAFRQGYIWGHANSGYEQPTPFYDSDNMLSTTPIDGITL